MKIRSISISVACLILLGGISLFIIECKPKNEAENNNEDSVLTNTQSAIRISQANVPDFNADSAYLFIAKQVSFGPRIPGTPAQTKCAEWITAEVRKLTTTVYVQDLKVELWNHQMVPCINIIASFNPDQKKRILLCTHWDTRPWSDRDSLYPKKTFDGADDGGSGVGVLLEIARQLSAQPAKAGIDIVFLDVEDYGPPVWDPQSTNEEVNGYCLGTQQWANTPHVPDYRAYFGILLDMVGAKNATFPQEGVSLQYAPSVVQKVWDIARALGNSNYFVNEKGPSITDDHTFVNSINGTPTIDIINMDRTTKNGFAKHWHTQDDDMSIIDRNTLKAVGQTLLQVVYTEPAESM